VSRWALSSPRNAIALLKAGPIKRPSVILGWCPIWVIKKVYVSFWQDTKSEHKLVHSANGLDRLYWIPIPETLWKNSPIWPWPVWAVLLL
jgi:hypothetical protein